MSTTVLHRWWLTVEGVCRGQLTKEEHRERGSVKSNVFLQYIQVCCLVRVLPMVFVSLLVCDSCDRGSHRKSDSRMRPPAGDKPAFTGTRYEAPPNLLPPPASHEWGVIPGAGTNHGHLRSAMSRAGHAWQWARCDDARTRPHRRMHAAAPCAESRAVQAVGPLRVAVDGTAGITLLLDAANSWPSRLRSTSQTITFVVLESISLSSLRCATGLCVHGR